MTESRKPIGAAIGITIIAGTTEGAYQTQNRSANEVISKGLYAGLNKENVTRPSPVECGSGGQPRRAVDGRS